MTYTSVAQIIEEIDRTRERLYQRFAGLTDEQSTVRPAPNVWTPAEIVEHLSLIEGRLLKMMTIMLTKAESAGGGGANGAPVEFKPFSLDDCIEQVRGKKFVAPEAVNPSGTASLTESLSKLRRSRADLKHLRPRIEALDLSTVTYPHPALGPLNFYQWLAFIGFHEERHLRQAEAALAS